MENETGVQAPSLHTLIPLGDFKAILGLDDREDALSRYCLITATYGIEQYCKRRLIHKKHTDYLTFSGPDEFFLDGEFTWPHAVPHFWSNTLTGSRAGYRGVYQQPRFSGVGFFSSAAS
jgi:hypothetical protein